MTINERYEKDKLFSKTVCIYLSNYFMSLFGKKYTYRENNKKCNSIKNILKSRDGGTLWSVVIDIDDILVLNFTICDIYQGKTSIYLKATFYYNKGSHLFEGSFSFKEINIILRIVNYLYYTHTSFEQYKKIFENIVDIYLKRKK